MVKVAVVGKDKRLVEKELPKHGLKLDKLNPDVVISFGGDGSALVAEQLYPGIPRLAIKHSRVCRKCIEHKQHDFSRILEKLKAKRYKIVEEIKVEGVVNDDKNKRLVGLNEINVSHAMPIKSIRFSVGVDGKAIAENLIGDGVLVATPYGSTAYFYSIVKRKFLKGLGIAFNNVRARMKSRMAKESSTIKVKIIRGLGLMCADNNTTMIPLRDGDFVKIKKAREKARTIQLEGEGRKIKV